MFHQFCYKMFGGGEDEGVEGSGEYSIRRMTSQNLHFDGSLRDDFENKIKLFRKVKYP